MNYHWWRCSQLVAIIKGQRTKCPSGQDRRGTPADRKAEVIVITKNIIMKKIMMDDVVVWLLYTTWIG